MRQIRSLTSTSVIVGMLCCAALLPGCGEKTPADNPKPADVAPGQPPSPAVAEPGVRSLGDFETGATDGWTGSDGTTLEISDKHASVGKKSLRVTLPKGSYPGVGRTLGRDDWSDYDALRFSVFNPGSNAVTLSLRIDDARASGYGERFNLEGKSTFTLAPGRRTNAELMVSALSVGTLESRGLDVRAIRQLKFFVGGVSAPTTLYFDGISLAKVPRTGPDRVSVVDYADTTTWRAHAGTKTTVAGHHLKLELTPEGAYPGVTFTKLPNNCLTYHLLSFNLVCPDGSATPGGIAVKLVDSLGRRRTFSTGLVKGINRVSLPLEIAGQLGLGGLTEVDLFVGKPDETQTILLTPPTLERLQQHLQPPVHAPALDDTQLTLDFTEAGAGGKNSCWGASVRIPRTDGSHALVYCSSPGKKQLKYAVPRSMFEDYDTKSPVAVWAYFFDHGQWTWGYREVTAVAGTPVVVRFTERRNLSK